MGPSAVPALGWNSQQEGGSEAVPRAAGEKRVKKRGSEGCEMDEPTGPSEPSIGVTCSGKRQPGGEKDPRTLP